MKKYKRPNILLIYTDQQRQDSIKCYGNKLAITPNLDKLASEGVRFDNYYVQNPVCMPSRMSFLTGRYCSSLGIGWNGVPFPDDAVAIHQLLKPYGYKTAQIGKLHFDCHSNRDHRKPTNQYGFDTLILSDEPGCYDDAYIKWVESIDPAQVPKVRTALPPAAVKYGQPSYSNKKNAGHFPYIFEGDENFTHSAFVASETCRFLENIKEKPFFAIAGFYAPHSPFNPPKRFVDMYDIKKMNLPKVGENEKINKELQNLSSKDWRKIVTYYMALVTHVDDCIGKILDALEKTGKEENTLVIFTSDHGEFLGDHGKMQKGMPGHDCITRIPYIMKYPNVIPEGKAINEMVEGVDFVPTILEYTGIQIPPYIQGIPMKRLIEGKTASHKEDIFIEAFSPFGADKQATVKTKEYMYYMSSDGKELLFDKKKDPDELNNIAGESKYKDILLEMRLRMSKRLMQAGFDQREKIADY